MLLLNVGGSSLRLPVTSRRRASETILLHTYTLYFDSSYIPSTQLKDCWQLTMRSIFSVLHRTATTSWHPPTRTLRTPRIAFSQPDPKICARCRQHQIRFSSNNQHPGDDARWLSVIDNPSQVVRVGRRHGPGLIILGMMHGCMAAINNA